MNTTLTDPDCPPSVRDQINGGVTQEAREEPVAETKNKAQFAPWCVGETVYIDGKTQGVVTEIRPWEARVRYRNEVMDREDHYWFWANQLTRSPRLAAPSTPPAEREQLEARVKELETDCARLEDELDEARGAPWPEWATKVLSIIRSRSGYDGSNDFEDGVDIPGELEEAFSELEHAAARAALQEQRP